MAWSCPQSVCWFGACMDEVVFRVTSYLWSRVIQSIILVLVKTFLVLRPQQRLAKQNCSRNGHVRCKYVVHFCSMENSSLRTRTCQYFFHLNCHCYCVGFRYSSTSACFDDYDWFLNRIYLLRAPQEINLRIDQEITFTKMGEMSRIDQECQASSLRIRLPNSNIIFKNFCFTSWYRPQIQKANLIKFWITLSIDVCTLPLVSSRVIRTILKIIRALLTDNMKPWVAVGFHNHLRTKL